MKRRLLFLVATLIMTTGFTAFSSCATARFNAQKTKAATMVELRKMARRNSPIDCLLYEGSDDSFHYFHHHLIGGGSSYRIPRQEWDPPKVFSVGTAPAQIVSPL
jgi:hypothetical protein